MYTHFILSKMSLREQLAFDFTFSRNRSTNSTLMFLCSTSQLFSNSFCSNIFCKCFEFFLSTNNFSEAATSNKSAPILFAAGTLYFFD